MVNRGILVAAILFVAGIFLSFSDGKINSRLQKKIDAAIYLTYGVKTSILKNIVITPSVNKETPAEFSRNNLFEIYNDDSLLGYLYLGEAPSMKRKFDYIVLFNTDFTIKKSKILIYREEHGRQIGSQRWLKQFIGLSMGDNLAYGENIDAISGATISASNMTKAVGDVLESLQTLRMNGEIK